MGLKGLYMNYNLLLVDDDRDFREEIRECLDDYNIIEASNGEQAIGILKRPNEIDLVILDVMMPGLSGTKVLKKIKNMNPDLGIIILTGFSSKDIAIDALRGHADDYIEKPVDIIKIKKTIEKLLHSNTIEKNINISEIDEKIDRIKRFINKNYDKRVNLKNTASAICLSPKYLSRIFKEKTGMGFNQYRLAIKIEKAEKLLEETDFNINQIADRIGYNNTESFNRAFKRIMHCTPTEYRKKGQEDNIKM